MRWFLQIYAVIPSDICGDSFKYMRWFFLWFVFQKKSFLAIQKFLVSPTDKGPNNKNQDSNSSTVCSWNQVMCDLLVETLHVRVKSIIIQKSSQITKSEELLIGNNVVEIISSVKLLENYIDDQLNLHISNICKSVLKQFNALLSFKMFLKGTLMQIWKSPYMFLFI